MAKGVRRSTEEIVAEYDKKINHHNTIIASLEADYAEKVKKHKDAIEKLEVKKEIARNRKPRTPRSAANTLVIKAKEMGLSDEEIAERLGISLETPSDEGTPSEE